MNHTRTLISTAITGPQYPPAGTTTVNRALTPKRARPVVENDVRAAFAHRILAAYAHGIAGGDFDSLSLLTGLSADIDTAIGQSVTGLRGFGYSCADIGTRLGVTCQAAEPRWGASRAALIYLHSTSDRQHRLADAVATRVRSELGQAGEDE
jgi:hypothetical protein